jgi:hypothetical protein
MPYLELMPNNNEIPVQEEAQLPPDKDSIANGHKTKNSAKSPPQPNGHCTERLNGVHEETAGVS